MACVDAVRGAAPGAGVTQRPQSEPRGRRRRATRAGVAPATWEAARMHLEWPLLGMRLPSPRGSCKPSAHAVGGNLICRRHTFILVACSREELQMFGLM